MVLRETLPPETALRFEVALPSEPDATRRPSPSRRDSRPARSPRRRRPGPFVAAGVVLAAAAGGSVAALWSNPAPIPEAAYPGGSRTTGVPKSGNGSGNGSGLSSSAGSRPSTGSSQALSPSGISISRAGTSATVLPAAQSYTGPPWPALTYTLRAAPKNMAPAPFPSAVPGYRLRNAWASSADLAADRHFTAVADLPARTTTFAQCRQQRFFIRWQAADPAAVVEASFVDAGVHTVQNTPVRGAAGWLSSFGCVQPALRIMPGTGPATASVIVQVQVWTRG